MSTDLPDDSFPSPAASLDSIDWAQFSFPTRPGTRSTKELMCSSNTVVREVGQGLASVPGTGSGYGSAAPEWAAPPTRVNSWHLDVERWVLSHPGQRKKLELLRLTTRRKLAMVVDLIASQPTEIDQAALWRGLNQSIFMAFGIGLGEMLYAGPDQWEWPLSVLGGGRGGGMVDQTSQGGPQGEDSNERRRMGLNGF